MAEHDNARTASITDTPDGHDIYHLFRVENASTGPWLAEHTYHTNCQVLLTSWVLRIFQPAGENAWFVALTRNDSNIDRTANASMCISFYAAENSPLSFPQTLSKDGMLPGDEVNSYIPLFQHPDVLENLPEGMLPVQVLISIRYCHSQKDVPNPVASLSGEMNKMAVSEVSM